MGDQKWCESTLLEIRIGLLIEPEIFSSYYESFDASWFPFYHLSILNFFSKLLIVITWNLIQFIFGGFKSKLNFDLIMDIQFCSSTKQEMNF